MEMSWHRDRKETMRGKSSICGKATKGTAKKGEASMFPTRKNTKVQ